MYLLQFIKYINRNKSSGKHSSLLEFGPASRACKSEADGATVGHRGPMRANPHTRQGERGTLALSSIIYTPRESSQTNILFTYTTEL